MSSIKAKTPGPKRRYSLGGPEAPMELFSGYLESGECAGPFTLYSKDGHYGHTGWRRSDMEEGDVEDGGTVEME